MIINHKRCFWLATNEYKKFKNADQQTEDIQRMNTQESRLTTKTNIEHSLKTVSQFANQLYQGKAFFNHQIIDINEDELKIQPYEEFTNIYNHEKSEL